ncbi:tripartite tricarboxylate transporter substrate binding protein [Alicycliphilus denitrificans]|jgi:tripartite-type tricarboxylate transporter receptor subunit TctC|uniref:Extra-cytoplasmic solute receptor family protein 110 n=2 Tax=Alicycliphilus denitrificans TaxID=179636 RepID=F4GBX6_ALIDK|nr:tripartite tricarboxylate transporter substrate binding protein [Alicycliphilus denitrificans]GAO25747.1 extra-cytoplasmic solute receptor family protein [Alicycliphilus sp. B1]ADU97812.1 putative secreted protein [Alicycliphilus denitrificans BC]AEB82470.1 extra-cytoplasmic solute receptor family protein 110 [Alicycliphilus denitrificans K601]QKD42156.1 tripartite tricarboxylate transporter substrate binding protein [Alicycliphilus denitrificans]RKJ95680.1 tripartite tricarboxylate transpo
MIKQLMAGIALAAAALCGPAQAQNYPSKPVTIVVPFAPGGATDIMARTLAERLNKRLGQPVIVENKPGAGTMIASEHVARAQPDGHTVLLAASSLGIAPALYAKVNYDPVKDFTPISLVASVVHVLQVHPSIPVKNVAELIAWVKANPGKANYGSVGAGTSTHLESELFNTMAGVKMTHVPYKGSAPALMDLVGGNLQVMFDAWASSGPFVKDGKTRLLAVTTAQRSKLLPDVPTVAESGLPGYEAMPWLGFVAPAGTPAAAVNRFHAELMEVLKEPEVQDKFRALGLDIIGNTPQQFADFIKRDIVKWAKVVKDSGAKAD